MRISSARTILALALSVVMTLALGAPSAASETADGATSQDVNYWPGHTPCSATLEVTSVASGTVRHTVDHVLVETFHNGSMMLTNRSRGDSEVGRWRVRALDGGTITDAYANCLDDDGGGDDDVEDPDPPPPPPPPPPPECEDDPADPEQLCPIEP